MSLNRSKIVRGGGGEKGHCSKHRKDVHENALMQPCIMVVIRVLLKGKTVVHIYLYKSREGYH